MGNCNGSEKATKGAKPETSRSNLAADEPDPQELELRRSEQHALDFDCHSGDDSPAGKPFYYWTYGTYKRGFPNFKDIEAEIEYVADATTVDTLMVTMQKEPRCDNPGCNLLHRRVVLYLNCEQNPKCKPEYYGKGKGPIKGELFKISFAGQQIMDKMENYIEGDIENSSYVRYVIPVQIEGEAAPRKTYAYGCPHVDEGIAEVEVGTHALIYELLREDAGSDTMLKSCCVKDPGCKGPHIHEPPEPEEDQQDNEPVRPVVKRSRTRLPTTGLKVTGPVVRKTCISG